MLDNDRVSTAQHRAIEPWRAPTAHGRIRAIVTVPGSKSLTNRELLLAALADGPSTITAALRSRDTELMIGALRAFGVRIESVMPRAVDSAAGPAPALRVTPPPDGLSGPAGVDCGLAGTVMRFVPPVAALVDGDVRFDGDPAARRRPMGPVLTALRTLGVTISGGRLPFTVHGAGAVHGGTVELDASGSSQFVSGLLLSAARFRHGLVIKHVGPPVPSLPHIAMTLDVLRARGVRADHEGVSSWTVAPAGIRAVDVTIEPDLSNASVFLAAAAVTGGQVTVPGWPAGTTQAGDAIRDVLTRMGCEVERTQDGLTVTGPAVLLPVDLDLRDIGELTPTIAAMCALADGPSTLRGIGHLRGHETDRLAALAAELSAIGATTSETDDGLVVRPIGQRAVGGDRIWRCYDDHRMATAGALLGLAVPGLLLDDVASTGKTMPGFTRLWREMLGDAGTAASGPASAGETGGPCRDSS